MLRSQCDVLNECIHGLSDHCAWFQDLLSLSPGLLCIYQYVYIFQGEPRVSNAGVLQK